MPAETVILTTWEIWNFEAGEKSLTDTNNSCHFGAMLHALVVVTTVVSIFFFLFLWLLCSRFSPAVIMAFTHYSNPLQ